MLKRKKYKNLKNIILEVALLLASRALKVAYFLDFPALVAYKPVAYKKCVEYTLSPYKHIKFAFHYVSLTP